MPTAQLGIPQVKPIVKGFDRPNLRYEVKRGESEAGKLKILRELFLQELEGTGIIYTATQKGSDCNFGEVFATDGRIKALDLTVMKDDKKFFPVYQGAFSMQESIRKKYPEIANILAKVSSKLTTEKMQELNAKVDVDGDEPADVAKKFLQDQGLI